jgi:hypothetical protein
VLNLLWFPGENGIQFASDGEMLYRKVGSKVQYVYWAWLPLSVKWEPWGLLPKVREDLWQSDIEQLWQLPQLGRNQEIAEA